MLNTVNIQLKVSSKTVAFRKKGTCALEWKSSWFEYRASNRTGKWVDLSPWLKCTFAGLLENGRKFNCGSAMRQTLIAFSSEFTCIQSNRSHFFHLFQRNQTTWSIMLKPRSYARISILTSNRLFHLHCLYSNKGKQHTQRNPKMVWCPRCPFPVRQIKVTHWSSRSSPQWTLSSMVKSLKMKTR